MSEFEVVVGIEIHAQISTKTKMFCRCDNDSFNKPPNITVCPVCMGFPGQLPVINKVAVDKGIIASLALNCDVLEYSKFDRKNYFYPDLPKGFQISQFDKPLSLNGTVEIEVKGEKKIIRVTRLHLEDDAGKLTHVSGGSLVDYNRSGTPLMEIVSEPDIRNGEEASAYAKEVRNILRFCEASEGDMEKGMLRFDASVSIRPRGDKKLYNRAEIKNLNSFKALEAAVDYEAERQVMKWEAGEPMDKDITMGWAADKDKTYFLRDKESSDDYRYFPEPDLPPLINKKEYVEKFRSKIPELPAQKRERYISEYDIMEDDARIMTDELFTSRYFDKVIEICDDAKKAVSFINTVLLARLKEEQIDLEESPVTAEMIGELIKLINDGEISNNQAKVEVFDEMYKTKDAPSEIVKRLGLKVESDEGKLRDLCKAAIKANPSAVEDIKNGKDKAIGFLVGTVMKETKGQANPEIVHKIMKEELS